jgi:hypothetical protein
MVVGAFGPWIELPGISLAGTNARNDGWILIGLGAIAAFFVWRRRTRGSAFVAALAGLAGLVGTIHDRTHVDDAVQRAGEALGGAAHVGWGLDVCLAGSASCTLAGILLFLRTPRSAAGAPASPDPQGTDG